MKCPDIETLISYATSPDGCDDIANHILECSECRKNLEIIHETMLAEKWANPLNSSGSAEKAIADEAPDVVSTNGKTPELNQYLHTAAEDMCDRFGIVSIPNGGMYLQDPITKECESATSGNIDEFIRNGMSFYIAPDANTHSKLNDMVHKTMEFASALRSNMDALKGGCIPDCNLPWWVKCIPYPFRINFRSCREIKVQQSDFLKHLELHGVVPHSHDVRAEIWRAIQEANYFQVYELRGKGVVFHVYSIFISCFALEAKDGVRRLVVKSADVDIYKTVAEFVKKWKGHLGKPNCLCLSIGSYGGWAEKITECELSDCIQVLSSPNGQCNNGWSVCHEKLEHMRPVFRTIVYRLYPESKETWHNRICGILKWNFADGGVSSASMTVARMSKESNIPQDCVAEIFEYLRTRDMRWRSVRIHTGELALVPSNGCRGEGAFISSQCKTLYSVGILIISVATAFAVRFICVKFDNNDVIGILAGFFTCFVLSSLKNNLERKIRE